MAHNISNESGKHEVFVAGEPAWHRLGVNTKESVHWEETMNLAGLNWPVEKRQLHTIPKDGVPQLVPAYGVFRNDTGKYLGDAGAGYQVLQNKKAFDFVDVVLQAEKGAHYVSAGALGSGEQIWCLAKIPGAMRIVNTDDVTDQYLLFTNWHYAGKSAIAKLTQTRVVCQNTMNIALEQENEFVRLRHDGTIDLRIEEAKKLLTGVRGRIHDVNEIMNIFARTQLKAEAIGDVLKTLYPTIGESEQARNKARSILDLYESNDGNAFPSERGTAYALLNSVTNFVDHKQGVRASDGETEDQARARVALFGKGDALKNMAMFAIMQAITKHSLAAVDEKKYFFLNS
jgi:phage/plasmid-like protein (TIGR03299 family)